MLDTEDVTACTSARLRRATRILSQAYDAALKPSGLKGTQFTLLATLNKTGELPLSQLAEVLGMERTTLTRNLKSMISKGFIEVVQDDDHRVRLVSMKSEGAKVLQQATPYWKDAQVHAVGKLGKKEWLLLMGSLEKISQ